jgi:hypothetical protein
VFLGGIPVAGDVIVDLAKLVKDPHLAEKLVYGVERDRITIPLDDSERAAILKALGADPGPGFRGVHEELLAEHNRRSARRP